MRDSSLINWLTWGGEDNPTVHVLVCPWCNSRNIKIGDIETFGTTRGGVLHLNYVRTCLDCKAVTETTAIIHNIGYIE